MSDFEIFTVVLSFILGLGVTQILSSVVYLVHARREITLRWTALLWAAAILAFHINFLYAALWFYSADREALWYVVDLLAAVLLFLSGGLILPSESRPLPGDLDDFFTVDGRLALIPLGLFHFSAIPYNVEGGLPLLAQDNIIQSLLLLLAAATFVFQNRVRQVASVLFAALTAYAFFFVFEQPGVG